MKQHIETITNLLLGAAYADKRLEGREVASIEALLTKLLGTAKLPTARAEQMRAFNPAKFDTTEATAALQVLPAIEKRRLLELIATVTESDGELDLDESDYLKKVALGLGLPETSFADLTLEVLEENELSGFFNRIA